MPKTDDLSRSVTAFEQGNTVIAVIEMSLSSWLVAGIVPGLERHPLKKLDADPTAASLARRGDQGWSRDWADRRRL
jgi:transposase